MVLAVTATGVANVHLSASRWRVSPVNVAVASMVPVRVQSVPTCVPVFPAPL